MNASEHIGTFVEDLAVTGATLELAQLHHIAGEQELPRARMGNIGRIVMWEKIVVERKC